MPSRIRAGLSYANVVATLALFVALGGGAFAATQLPRNSVGTGQLKKNAVRSADVKNRSLRPVDFARGTLPRGRQGVAGATGATGLRGAAGARGPQGRSGATNVTVRSAFFSDGAEMTVQCQAGEVATGGGVGVDLIGQYVALSEPTPGTGTPTGWKARIGEEDQLTYGSGTIYVVCAKP